MGPRTRILDAAMLVFRRQGFRRSSIEQAAEAAGLTRQALYHHFKSKEALFRAVIERLHEEALAAEIAAASAAEKQGGSLADILVASVAAKLGQLAASLDGSPHVEELFSEHLLQARDLYQKYTTAYAEQLAETIARVCRKQGLTLNAGMTPRDFARLHRDGDQRHQVRLSRDAAGRCFPEGSGNHAAHAGGGRRAPGDAEAARAKPKTGKESFPIHRPQTWSSQMSTMTINGKLAPLPDDPDALLVDVVRDALDLTGTKLVCGAGVCGACTVLVDGEPAVSCLMPARSAANTNVTTVEGIGAAKLHPVQQAFMAHDALQCGFCTPGFIVEAAAFHDRWRAAKGTAVPSREEIGAALSGHLCRCGAYDGIFRAVADACAGRFDGNDILPPRMEARDKVTGSAKYTVDIHHDGQLEGVILRSPFAHARIGELDLAAARAMPGVSAAISLLGDDRIVRYVGEPIAAVAARDRKTALAAIAAIKFGSERLPSAIGLDDARKADAPVVFEKSARKKAGNVSEGARFAGRLERQYPRTVGGVLQEAEEGAELGRGRAHGEQSAAGRGHLPHRHATARLPRAARRGGAFRRRPAHRACLDAGGVSCDGADRQALQARPRQGARDCRPCRRRVWFKGRHSAWRPPPRSNWRVRPRRRSGLPTTATRSFR